MMAELRERILLCGPPGSGKSYAALTIARRYTNSQFWVLDTDQAWPRMMSGQFSDLQNVHVFECNQWEDYIAALTSIKKQAVSGDWLIVDFMSTAWDDVQDYFIREVFDQNVEAYYLARRKEAKKSAKSLEVFEGWVDWPVIKAQYKGFRVRHIGMDLRQCHQLFTTAIRSIQKGETDAGRLSFSPYGGYPAGEKNLPYQCHAVLMMSRPRLGVWELSSYKDRERPLLDHAELTDFAKDYVLKVAKLKR